MFEKKEEKNQIMFSAILNCLCADTCAVKYCNILCAEGGLSMSMQSVGECGTCDS